MNTNKLIVSGAVALGLSVSAYAGEGSYGPSYSSPSLSGVTSSAKSLSGSAVDGAKGLLSLPGKALSFGDDALPNLSAGTQEFGLAGRVGIQDDFDANFILSYGYFFKDNWQVGFNADAVLKEGSVSNGNGDSLTVSLFTEYHFDIGSKWVPFVGASVGLGSVSSTGIDGSDDISSDGIEVAGVVGIKYFITQNIAISSSLDFAWNSGDALDTDFGGDVNIGTRFYF